MYGESTPAGLEWQFRDIKKLAKSQQEAVENGESPAGLLRSGGGATTPSSRSLNASTPGSRASKAGSARTTTPTPTPGGNRRTAAGGRSGAGLKRKQSGGGKATGASTVDDDDVEDDSEYDDGNGGDVDETPTDRKKRQRQAKYPPSAGTDANASGALSFTSSAGGANGAAAGGNKANINVITLDDDDVASGFPVNGDGVGHGGSTKPMPVKQEPVVPVGMSSMAEPAYFDNNAHYDDAYGGEDMGLPDGEV